MSKDNLQELLDLIEGEETKGTEEVVIPSKDNKEVIKFLKKTGLAPGENKVPTYIIYYAYREWAVANWVKVWKKEEFFRTFKRYFTQKRTGRQRYYLINDAIQLTEEYCEKAEKYRHGYYNKKKK
jgi:hypothetical protein